MWNSYICIKYAYQDLKLIYIYIKINPFCLFLYFPGITQSIDIMFKISKNNKLLQWNLVCFSGTSLNSNYCPLY